MTRPSYFKKVVGGICQQVLPVWPGVREHEDGEEAAVREPDRFLTVLAVRIILPSDEVRPTLVHVGDRDADLATELPVNSGRVLVGAGSARRRVDVQVRRIDPGNDVRVPARRGLELRGRHWRHARMEVAELTSQHSLAEASVARTHHRAAVRRQFRGDAEARRHDVPFVQEPAPLDDPVCLLPFGIEGGKVLADGTGMIEPQSSVQRRPVAQRDGVTGEDGSGQEQAAAVGWLAGNGLERRTTVVDVPGAGGNHDRGVMFAALELKAGFEFMFGAEQARPVMRDRRFPRSAA